MIKIAFKRSTNFLEYLISWFTFGPYCHVCIINDKNECYSCDKNYGVFKYNFVKPELFDYIELQSSKEKEILNFLENELGCKYDVLGVVRFIIPFIKESKDKWFCSEIMAQALSFDDKLKDFKNSPHKYSPNGVYRKLKELLNVIPKQWNSKV